LDWALPNPKTKKHAQFFLSQPKAATEKIERL